MDYTLTKQNRNTGFILNICLKNKEAGPSNKIFKFSGESCPVTFETGQILLFCWGWWKHFLLHPGVIKELLTFIFVYKTAAHQNPRVESVPKLLLIYKTVDLKSQQHHLTDQSPSGGAAVNVVSCWKNVFCQPTNKEFKIVWRNPSSIHCYLGTWFCWKEICTCVTCGKSRFNCGTFGTVEHWNKVHWASVEMSWPSLAHTRFSQVSQRAPAHGTRAIVSLQYF